MCTADGGGSIQVRTTALGTGRVGTTASGSVTIFWSSSLASLGGVGGRFGDDGGDQSSGRGELVGGGESGIVGSPNASGQKARSQRSQSMQL